VKIAAQLAGKLPELQSSLPQIHKYIYFMLVSGGRMIVADWGSWGSGP